MAKRGRSAELIEKRNRKLIERYYYWTEVKRRRFDDVLKILQEEEFFIGEQTIMLIIRQNNETLNEMRLNRQGGKQMKLFTDELDKK